MGKLDNDGPLVVDPIGSQTHTHTLVMLHGRGSNSERFTHDTSVPDKPGFLHAHTSSGQTLQQYFPGLKIIFPQAPLRRCTAKKRMKMNIWFDSASFDDPTLREDIQIEGISSNAKILAEMLQAEADALGWNKVFLGGLSQGCAMGVFALAKLDTGASSLAGFIGLSGRLPFQNEIDEILLGTKETEQEDGDDPFAADKNDTPEEANKPFEALTFMRQEILDSECSLNNLKSLQKTHFFFGHGAKDDVVPPELSTKLANTMEAMGCPVIEKVYPELGHWFEVPAEIDDLVEFMKSKM